MHRLTITILGALDQEYHEKRNDSGSGIDHELPGIAEMKNGAGDRPDNDDAEGKREGPLLASSTGDGTGKTFEFPDPLGHWLLSAVAGILHGVQRGQLVKRNVRREFAAKNGVFFCVPKNFELF